MGVSMVSVTVANSSEVGNDRGATGEQALWIAVLSNAVHDATIRMTYLTTFNTVMIRENARAYLRGNSNGFQLVCDYAGVEPHRVRAALELAISLDKHEAANQRIVDKRIAEAKQRMEIARKNKTEYQRRQAAKLALAAKNIELQRAIAAVLAGQGDLFRPPVTGNGG